MINKEEVMQQLLEQQKVETRNNLKAYLTKNKDLVETVYGVIVPELTHITNRDLKHWVLEIQDAVYKKAGELGVETDMFIIINKYLFVRCEDVITNINMLRDWDRSKKDYSI